MTREEKNELLTQLGSEDYEAYMELRRQMDVLAADERMDDTQKAAFYAEIRDELVLLRKRRDLMAKKLQAFNELIDEVETRLKETEQYDRRKKKKVRILPPAPTNAQIDYREKQEAHFAQGMTFYKRLRHRRALPERRAVSIPQPRACVLVCRRFCRRLGCGIRLLVVSGGLLRLDFVGLQQYAL